jgi:histidine ammonia-lyase
VTDLHTFDRHTDPAQVVVGILPLTIEDLLSVAGGRASVAVSDDVAYRAWLARGVARLTERIASGARIYGVTTGFGDSCDTDVNPAEMRALALNLVRFHRCGTGRIFDEQETLCILVARIASLCRGYSAVRPEILEGLAALVNHRILPRIPSEGSVGASGDLTPLSYVAAALVGEGEVSFRGTVRSAAAALAEVGIPLLEFWPKESLALINGTSAMTGLAALAFCRAQRLARFSAALTALAVETLRGEPRHFDPRIFGLKPHPGQAAFARWVREDLGEPARRDEGGRLQDRYSLRCAPHVAGVLLDVLPGIRSFLEIELNSVNDNPIVDPESGDILHSGNFYGGHVCHAMDSLKTCTANVADLLDRQLALLCNPVTNSGLPSDLVSVPGRAGAAHHGFKAMQISASALTAEALKLTLPASAFSRSTENHNQDKVSMGTIGARDCLRVLELTETVAVIHVLALCQAVDLRGPEGAGPRARALHGSIRETVQENTGDRPMDVDIQSVLSRYRRGELPIGDADFG